MELHSSDGRLTLRAALPADRGLIESLLVKVGLPVCELDRHLENFLVAHHHDQLLGCAGMEIYGKTALLRSLAVVPAYQGFGLGRKLTGALLAAATRRGVLEAVVLTSTAVELASSFSFRETPRGSLPSAVLDSWEFSGTCCSSARCMRLSLEPQFFGKTDLSLTESIAGTRMWAVGLTHAMLTYFEVEAGCRFESHTHPNEQITLVLEGELFFEYNGKVVRLNAGEAIAIPADVSHSVFTEAMPARAVDAWSPPPSAYQR
jgi:amino-acid N-acetyltransferase